VSLRRQRLPPRLRPWRHTRDRRLSLHAARPSPPRAPLALAPAPDPARSSGGFFLGLAKQTDGESMGGHQSILEQVALPLGQPASPQSSPPSATAPRDMGAAAGHGAAPGLPVAAFAIDGSRGALLLSPRPLIPRSRDAVALEDLRAYGTGVRHYAARVSRLYVDGERVYVEDRRPITCIFDTGLTCAVVSEPLAQAVADCQAARGSTACAVRWNGEWGTGGDQAAAAAAKARPRPPETWTSLELELRTEQGKTLRLGAGAPLSAPLPGGESGESALSAFFFATAISEESIFQTQQAPEQQGGSSVDPGHRPPEQTSSGAARRSTRGSNGAPSWFPNGDDNGAQQATTTASGPPLLVAIGQAFLAGGRLTVDVDAGRLTFEPPAGAT